MRYTVRAGDTVASIAQRFRVDVDDVLRLNPSIRTIHDRLVVGVVIIIPAAVVVDCPVPEPVMERIVPAGAGVTVRIVRLSRRRIPERVLVCRVRGTRVICSIVVIRFGCDRGWRVIYRRDNVGYPIDFLSTGSMLGDDREQVVIGGAVVTRNNLGLCYTVLGCQGEEVVELMDRLDRPVEYHSAQIEGGRLVLSSQTGQTMYAWNGSSMVLSR